MFFGGSGFDAGLPTAKTPRRSFVVRPGSTQGGSVNRRELVNAVAAETGVDSKQVDAVIKGFTDVVTTTVSGGETVAITGFCKFAKVERAARMGRNPATGETIRIKASK